MSLALQPITFAELCFGASEQLAEHVDTVHTVLLWCLFSLAFADGAAAEEAQT